MGREGEQEIAIGGWSEHMVENAVNTRNAIHGVGSRRRLKIN